MPDEHSSTGHDPRRLADFIRSRRDQIIASWEASARQLRPGRDLGRLALLDHMPQFLDELASFIDDLRAGLDPRPPDEVSQMHALERLDEGYDLSEVVAEYGALRSCLNEIVTRDAGPALRSLEMPRLHQAIDKAIATSVVRFTMARERTLKALDRISTAALAHPDVKDFLDETLRVLLETTAAVDSVSVLLLENGVLHVRAAVGFALPAGSGASVRVGECLPGRIAETRSPLFVRDCSTDECITSDIIVREGTHALYGVPLLLGEELIGVAMMGSRTTYEFSQEDRVLFRTMAARATALIVQRQLRERERALRAELQVQKDFYSSLLQAQSDLGEALVVIRDRRIVEVNDAFCRLTGYERREVLGMTAFENMIALEQRGLLRERFARRMSGEEVPGQYETVILDKRGDRLEVELAIKRRGEEVLVIGRDITQRKAAERERELVRERLDAILRVLPVGVVIADAPSGHLVRGNEAFERMAGRFLPADNVEGYGVYRGLWPDGRPLEPDQWPIARAARHGESVASQEVHLLREDGTRVITEQAAAPIRDASGKNVAAVVTLVDITARKRAQQELQQAVRFRDEIMAVLSHDLRTPLSVAMTSAEVLERSGNLDQKQARVVARIKSSGMRIEHMIRDLLDYTRARQGGGIPVSPRPADLAVLLRQAIDEQQTLHPDRTFQLSMSGSAQGRWDPERLAQVVQNLLANAARHAGPGQVIEVRLRDEPPLVVLEVHNGGPPIPEEMLPVVFEPFRRGAQLFGGASGGLGLGLYIVRAIVAAHGGTALVRSSAAEGTTFTVRLPRDGV